MVSCYCILRCWLRFGYVSFVDLGLWFFLGLGSNERHIHCMKDGRIKTKVRQMIHDDRDLIESDNPIASLSQQYQTEMENAHSPRGRHHRRINAKTLVRTSEFDVPELIERPHTPWALVIIYSINTAEFENVERWCPRHMPRMPKQFCRPQPWQDHLSIL